MPDGPAQASLSRQSESVGEPLIGRVIHDRFTVCSLIARGGMGMVYQAEQAPLGRKCALKVLSAKQAVERDPGFEKRFFLEASIASKLTHPNTVTVFDYGCTTDGLYYMAMEYLDGRTLHRAIREEGPFSEERTSYIAKQICRSLQEAHSLGVIHRDLKPTNIYLAQHGDERDFVKVLDFGLVKNIETGAEILTEAGLFMGSPKYMAPEQIKGDPVDGRTDVYALGLVMYEMLTGRVPFDHPNSVHIMMAHVNDVPPPMRSICPDAEVSDAFDALVFKCLEKDPTDRYASMDALLTAIKELGRPSLENFVPVFSERSARNNSSGGKSVGASGNASDGSGAGASKSSAKLLAKPSTKSKTARHAGNDGTSGSGTDHASSQQPAQKKASVGTFAVFVGAAITIGVAGVAFLTMTSDEPAEPPSPPATDDPVAEPSGASSSTPVGTVASIAVDLVTVPAGATVATKDGKVLCSSTPCQVKFEGADADEGRQHELVFEKPGYRKAIETISVSRKDLAARLVSLARGDTNDPQQDKVNKTQPAPSPDAGTTP